MTSLLKHTHLKPKPLDLSGIITVNADEDGHNLISTLLNKIKDLQDLKLDLEAQVKDLKQNT